MPDRNTLGNNLLHLHNSYETCADNVNNIMGYTSTSSTFSSHSDVLMISVEYPCSLFCDCSPRGERLDVKKSNFKKMSAFIKVMQEKGLVTVRQLTKGVDSIVKVNQESDM